MPKVNLKQLKRDMRLGTEGPWEFDPKGCSVMGGKPPRKALHSWKTTICDVPMADMVTGLLSSKEREANGRRIERLVYLEEDYLEALSEIETLKQRVAELEGQK